MWQTMTFLVAKKSKQKQKQEGHFSCWKDKQLFYWWQGLCKYGWTYCENLFHIFTQIKQIKMLFQEWSTNQANNKDKTNPKLPLFIQKYFMQQSFTRKRQFGQCIGRGVHQYWFVFFVHDVTDSFSHCHTSLELTQQWKSYWFLKKFMICNVQLQLIVGLKKKREKQFWLTQMQLHIALAT